jgi:sigma-B regulation protein RsbU (phosphoserine phosphatase)
MNLQVFLIRQFFRKEKFLNRGSNIQLLLQCLLLDIASSVQKLLFPKELPDEEDLKVHASYIPHRNVGGDYYDFIPISRTEFLICIADVSGKGMPAAILMANFQASLRTIIRRTINLKLITNELNYQVAQSGNGESFITFFVAIYNKRNKELRYVNAGHNPPFLMAGSEHVQALEDGTTILGSFRKLPFLNEGVISHLQHFLLFSYTDGLTEAFNNQGEPYGPEKVEEFLSKNFDTPLKELHSGLLDDVYAFAGKKEFDDDITMLSCRVIN